MQFGQLAGVVGRVGLYLNSQGLFGTVHQGKNGQNGGPTAHIEHLKSAKIGLQNPLKHQVGRGVVPGAKSHLRKHLNAVAVVFEPQSLVKGGVDN